MAKIFSIVSVVSNFYGPLTDLIYILDMYQDYKYAIRSLNNFFFNLDDQQNDQAITSESGTVKFKNCEVERVDEVDMFKGIRRIFGEHLKSLGDPKNFYENKKGEIYEKEKTEKNQKLQTTATIMNKDSKPYFSHSEFVQRRIA